MKKNEKKMIIEEIRVKRKGEQNEELSQVVPCKSMQWHSRWHKTRNLYLVSALTRESLTLVVEGILLSTCSIDKKKELYMTLENTLTFM